MRYALIALAVVAVLLLLILTIGWMLPVGHRVTRDATLNAEPAELFKLITDVRAAPQWRPSVKDVQVPPAVDGHAQFKEVGKNGSILFQIDSIEPNRYLVTRIADRSLPFGGKWTYELIPKGDSTTLRITEDGEVYNPLFRFVSRFVMGHTATIDEYLADVKKRFGQS